MKICKYCDRSVDFGTIICPFCGRVLPPEAENAERNQTSELIGQIVESDVLKELIRETVRNTCPLNREEEEKKDKESRENAIMHLKLHEEVQKREAKLLAMKAEEERLRKKAEEERIAKQKEQEEENARRAYLAQLAIEREKIAEETRALEKAKRDAEIAEQKARSVEFTPMVERIVVEVPIEKTEEKKEDTQVSAISEFEEEEIYFDNLGKVQTREFKMGVISPEEEKKSSFKHIGIILAVFTMFYAIAGLFSTYMHHDYADTMGYEMLCSIIIALRDVFPAPYRYILYNSDIAKGAEVLGSVMPYGMLLGGLFAIVGMITANIARVPRKVTIWINLIALFFQVLGASVMVAIFGFSSLGISPVIIILSTLLVFVLHALFCEKETKRVSEKVEE